MPPSSEPGIRDLLHCIPERRRAGSYPAASGSPRSDGILLDALRARKAAGAAVEVMLYDPGSVPERDRGMAQKLAAALGPRPDAFAVVLSGNLHNRLTVGTPFDADHKPMGHLLVKRLDRRRVVSLDMAHQGGTAWLCFGSSAEDCGPKEVSVG